MPILMTYPARSRAHFFRRVNSVIRIVARNTTAHLIDLTKAFTPRCPKKDCPELLIWDYHPNAEGNRLVAETIVSRLKRLPDL